MILRETLLHQGPEYCASLHGGRVPELREWLQWVEMSIARMTTHHSYCSGDLNVRIFVENGFRVINFWHTSGEKRRRCGEIEALAREFSGHTAYELYPAESRLVDSGDEYHLWVPMFSGWSPGLPSENANLALDARIQRSGRLEGRVGGLRKLLEEFGIDWGSSQPPDPGDVRGSVHQMGEGFVIEECVVWACRIGGWVRLWVWTVEKGFRASWAQIQRIKNNLMGPEHEGVEAIGESESDLSGSRNGRVEVWVLAKPGIYLPFGYEKRWVNRGGLVLCFPSQALCSESQRAASA